MDETKVENEEGTVKLETENNNENAENNGNISKDHSDSKKETVNINDKKGKRFKEKHSNIREDKKEKKQVEVDSKQKNKKDKVKIKKKVQNKKRAKHAEEDITIEYIEGNERKTRKLRSEENENNKKKGKKKAICVVIIILLIGIIAVASYFAYLRFSPKFQDVNIELGTESVTLDQFLKDSQYQEKASFVTDISTIDFSKAGSYTVELMWDGITQTVNLNIVDTVAPVVEFRNLDKYVDYELNADDFIKSKTDLAEMTTSIVNPPEINEIGTYQITVEVKDASGNTTTNVCDLNVSRVKKSVTLELGDELEKKDILLNYKEDKDSIKQSDIDKINKEEVGEYEIVSEINGAKETVKIIIKDTKAPDLKLKKVTIYDDEEIDGKEDFISSVKDASGDVKTTLKTEIDYSKIGTQDIVIEAEDKYGNKVEKTTTLTIRKDTDGPVFYGVSSMSVTKNSSVNFKRGVSAVDARDGSCSFTVDTSNVNLSKAGTYYAKYTAKDKKGNTTTVNRKVTVNHNQEDTNNKFNEFYNSYLAGQSVQGMVSTIKNKIGYNSSWGGDDPVWYGLTNYSGNCYVHALLVQKALNKAGYENRLIYTTDRTHYWNLVYQNGVWRHYDATPAGGHETGPLTDEQKLNSSAMHGRTWADSFPKAE